MCIRDRPTSTGYGASFEGLAPLLSMLNSCAPGVSVVNIDNGFGAGHIAALINGVEENASAKTPENYIPDNPSGLRPDLGQQNSRRLK